MADFIQNGGSNGGTYASYFSGILSVWENSYNIENNTSNVGYRLQLKSGSSGRFSGITANYSVNIGGTVVNSGEGTYASQSYNTAQTICEGTTTIYHNEDGSKNIACSAVLDFQSHTYSPGDFYPSGNLWLTTIPRASSVSCTTANIEETAIIVINSASTNFRHNIKAQFGDLNINIAENQAGGSFSWNIPTSFYSKIPNSKSGTGTITCETYNNGNWVGSKSSSFTVTTNEEKCKPTLNATVIDTNQSTINLTGSNTKLVKHKSIAKITITTSAKNSASISNKKVNNLDVPENNISITNIETDTFIVTVTDSRGYTNTVTLKPTVINYITLTINATIKRTQPTTGEVDISFSGNYFNGNFGKTSNTLSISWYYREKGKEQWTNGGKLTPSIKENTYNNGNTAISLGKIFDYQKQYEFYLKVEDKLTVLQPNYSITQGIPIFNWGKDFFNINGALKINESNILEIMFPIGTTYITQTNTNPNSILGFGTWERLKGKVCLGLDENDTNLKTIGKTGGEKTHTLTVNEMPSHNHEITNEYGTIIKPAVMATGVSTGYELSQIHEGSRSYVNMQLKGNGGDAAHNNMQPYEVVGYMWIRRS